MKTTLRRILKYSPVVALGLLLVAWTASEFWRFGFSVLAADTLYGVEVRESEVILHSARGLDLAWYDRLYYEPIEPGTPTSSGSNPTGIPDPGDPELVEHYPPRLASLLGNAHVIWYRDGTWAFFVPLLVWVTAFVPLAIGPFLGFRFRLWHYLAYTALVAVELAYYLRWQE